MARVALGAAALITLGAGLASPWPYEYRTALIAGAALALLYLVRESRRQ
jgi:membrane protein implicated in regulation of membrane protease activity